MMRHVFLLTFSFSLFLLFVPACTQSPGDSRESPKQSVDATREEVTKLLGDADQAWAETTDAEGFLSFFADDPIWIFCGEPKMEGKEEVAELASSIFARPESKLDWKAERIEVGTSGDMGYTAGNWQASHENPDGQLVEESGSYLAIWKKQEDGQWKVAVEIDFPDQKLFEFAESSL